MSELASIEIPSRVRERRHGYTTEMRPYESAAATVRAAQIEALKLCTQESELGLRPICRAMRSAAASAQEKPGCEATEAKPNRPTDATSCGRTHHSRRAHASVSPAHIALSQTPTGSQLNLHTTYGAGLDTTIAGGAKTDSHDAATHRQ